MENLKPGTVLCQRDWNIYNMKYTWLFKKVKRITPAGKIRLESGELLTSLGAYKVYNAELEKIYIQDVIKNSVIDMIRHLGNDSKRLVRELSINNAVSIGDLFKNLELENIDGWSRGYNKDLYKNALDIYVNSRNEIELKGVNDKSKLETTKQCLKEILEEKEELEELNDSLDSVSYGLSQSITNLRNVLEIIDAKLEDL